MVIVKLKGRQRTVQETWRFFQILVMSKQVIIPVRSLVNIHTKRTQGRACKLCVSLTKRSNIFRWKHNSKRFFSSAFQKARKKYLLLQTKVEITGMKFKKLQSSCRHESTQHNGRLLAEKSRFRQMLKNSHLSFITRYSFGIENRDEKV